MGLGVGVADVVHRLIDNMTRLVEMFPGGYEEWEKEQQGKMK